MSKIEQKHPRTGELYCTIDTFCGWGEGADVGINYTRHMLHGKKLEPSEFFSMDLTIKEARQLAYTLLKCADEAQDLEDGWMNYWLSESLRKENEKLNLGLS